MIKLSPAEARKIVLLSQGIHQQNQLGRGQNAVLKAIEQLGYVQIDSISVVQRAHHHSLWNRVREYRPTQLDGLLEQQQIFEYWSHAAAYLPMRDYRFSLPRKQAIAGGAKHWHVKDARLADRVIQRITAEGPLQARDFKNPQNRGANAWWQWKPAKQALEQLFMEGELMVVRRRGFQKVYDLTERVLPPGIDTSTPDQIEFQQHLINQFLMSNGIGTPAEISYLRKGMHAPVAEQCRQMVADGQLRKVEVNHRNYYAMNGVRELLSKKLSRSKVKILSPFDNLLIQRQRMLTLFAFDYQLECYVTAAGRKYGYFCLPLLWGHNFAGRMDVKMHRKSGLLEIVSLHLETQDTTEFISALKICLSDFMKFNQADRLQLSSLTENCRIVTGSAWRKIKTQLENP
ncbi:MAG: winged helix-turn-helix domain-containing protein [Gammaproteobacteria bacterium]|nr:winged helix-turn-helix domain-containing protein [Gammaproteobacteria bacterium]